MTSHEDCKFTVLVRFSHEKKGVVLNSPSFRPLDDDYDLIERAPKLKVSKSQKNFVRENVRVQGSPERWQEAKRKLGSWENRRLQALQKKHSAAQAKKARTIQTLNKQTLSKLPKETQRRAG